MPDVYLSQGLANPNDVKLQDPTQAYTPLAAASSFALATVAALTITATLSAASEIDVSSTANLNVSGPLLATSTISLSTDAQLSGATTLAAQSTIAVSTTAGPILMTADFAAQSVIPIASSTPLLSVGGVSVSAVSSFAIATQGTISGLAAQLAATSSFAFASTGDISVTGPSATTVVITFNGVVQTSIRMSSLTITDVLNEAPNTCEFMLDGAAPAIGTDVKIGLQNVLPGNLLFAGTIQRVDQRYEAGKKENTVWSVGCSDYTYLLNRRLVTGTWTDVSATTVAQQIVTTFAPGFSTAGIAGSLATITVTFTGVPVMAALAEIANLVGGYTYVDYGRVVRLFLSDTSEAPSSITGVGPPLLNTPPITSTSDEAQLRTRVIVRGKSANVSGPQGFNLPAGSTQIPVDDGGLWTLPPGTSSSNAITDDAQVVTYTGTHPGGVASTVTANVPAPVSAPTTAIASGVAGGLAGVYQYKVAFANSGGETEVGPASVPITAPTVSAPLFAPGIGQPSNNAIGPLVGAYSYAVSYVTTLGETLRSPLASRTAVALAAPTVPLVSDAPAAGNLQVGATYKYVVTYVTAYGETTPSNPVTYVPSALQQASFSSPFAAAMGGVSGGPYLYGVSIVTAVGESSPPTTLNIGSGYASAAPTGSVTWSGTQDTNGRIAPGFTYIWACSFYSDIFGETPLGPQFSLPIGGTLNIRLFMNVPTALPTGADGLRIYRGFSGGNPFMLNADFRRGSIPSQYWDALSQGECGTQHPASPIRAGVAVQLSVGPSAAPGVVARRIYRTKAGGTDLYFVGELQNNVSTTFTEGIFDTQLTARNPAVQTTGRQALLTSIPTNPTFPPRPGILGRRIYRTQANGSVYFLVGEIKDATTTQFQDNLPDAALTSATAPGTSTAGGEQTQITSVPTGPAGTLARRIYRTVAGGTELKLLDQISDNTTTLYLDSKADADLGPTAPLVNTAGASAVQLSNVPIGGTGVTQRIIYRTAAGGTDFKYVGTINDNSTTTYLDAAADTSLGRLPQATSTIGALAGDASVLLKSTAGWPTSGWFEGDGQIIRYTGITGNLLTGIPPLLTVSSITRSGTTATATTASAHGFTTGQRIVVLGADQPEYTGGHTVTVTGTTTFTYDVTGSPATPATGTIKVSQPGAISGALAGGTTVQTIAMLTGVSGLVNPIAPGRPIALWVIRNSPSGQSTIAAAEGGDGVHEFLVSDGALDSVAACAKRGDAELTLFQFSRIQVAYATHDTKTRSGKTVHIALGAPQNISGDFLIQSVTITEIDRAPRTPPRYAVTASNTKFSLQDVLRHVVLDI